MDSARIQSQSAVMAASGSRASRWAMRYCHNGISRVVTSSHERSNRCRQSLEPGPTVLGLAMMRRDEPRLNGDHPVSLGSLRIPQ